MTQYDLVSLRLPKLSGMALSAFTSAMENALLRPLALGNLLENGGIPKLRKMFLGEPPTFTPLCLPDDQVGQSAPPPTWQELEETASPNVPYSTIRDYTEAYRQGKTTPLEVAENILSAIHASNQGDIPLNAFIAVDREDLTRQARMSTQRMKEGRPLSLLDGVPIAIKDEVDQSPFPTTVGTRFLGKKPVTQDSTVVGRLRAAGALLIGKTNMHEIGINPNGANAFHGRVANPYDLRRDTGGSSSGSAAAVAAGLCPVAIGADGGGSIRIPASLCGIVGLKPTFGRVSEYGAFPLCWSVAHLGPLSCCVEDTVLVYATIAGADKKDPNSIHQPPLRLDHWNTEGLKGVRLGIFRQWFEHADSEVVKANQNMLQKFVNAGATLVEFEIGELEAMRIAHSVIILTEMAASMNDYPEHRKELSASTRLTLVLARALTSHDYLQAQRLRTRAMRSFAQVFQDVDVILTPTTALTAPIVQPNPSSNDWSDLSTDVEMMRFVFASNLTGHPAMSFPVGYDSQGMPIGMQAIGRHWEEHLLLRIAYQAERFMERQRPETFYKILE